RLLYPKVLSFPRYYSHILKINDYTDTRYLALYDFVLHFVASANLGVCES
ncbi:hypothetical protein ALC62_08187, partial [Cyphomyrmex costatus]